MKKGLSAFLAAVIVVTFAAFALASGSSDDKNDEKKETAAAQTEAAESNKLGEYTVEIKSARITKDYEGKAVVVITYGYTNNSDSPAAFDFSFDDNVYQAGIGLNKAYVLNSSDPYSSDNQSKQIKKGASIDVEVAYELNDTETDVEVEVGELISFDDTVVSRTFQIK